jgi:hypothetical protein
VKAGLDWASPQFAEGVLDLRDRQQAAAGVDVAAVEDIDPLPG